MKKSNILNTRMHSSRMHTALSLPYWGISVQVGLCLGGLFPAGISVQVGGVSVRGRGLCPGGFLSGGISVQGGLCPEGFLYRGRGVSVWRGLCIGVVSVWKVSVWQSLFGVSVWGVSVWSLCPG